MRFFDAIFNDAAIYFRPPYYYAMPSYILRARTYISYHIVYHFSVYILLYYYAIDDSPFSLLLAPP